MKKIAIIAVLAAMAFALIYKYSSRQQKSVSPVMPPSPAESLEEGKALPSDAKRFVSEAETEVGSICSKNLVSIIEDFGKVWHPAPPKDRKIPLIDPETSLKISRMLGSYYACSALSYHDRERCNVLPSLSADSNMPREVCAYKYDNITLAAFAAGKYDKNDACKDFMESHKISGVDENVFCEAVKGGFAALCEKMSGKTDKSLLKECQKVFPKNKSACSSDEEGCLEPYMAYEAFSSNSADKCLNKEQCQAFNSKTEAACVGIKEKLINFYCEAYEAGLKKAEADAKKLEEMEKAKLADIEKQKAYEERKRKDSEKAEAEKLKEKLKRAQEEADKEIKKMLEKRPGSGE